MEDKLNILNDKIKTQEAIIEHLVSKYKSKEDECIELKLEIKELKGNNPINDIGVNGDLDRYKEEYGYTRKPTSEEVFNI